MRCTSDEMGCFTRSMVRIRGPAGSHDASPVPVGESADVLAVAAPSGWLSSGAVPANSPASSARRADSFDTAP
eukprot:1963409-Prymnesium_polylepis.2